MNRAQLLELRSALLARLKERRRVGDYDVSAADLTATLEAVFALAEHLLEKAKR